MAQDREPFSILVHDHGAHYSLRSTHATKEEAEAEFERRINTTGRWRPYYVRATGPGLSRTWENPEGIGEFG